jgi:hypothetical protein
VSALADVITRADADGFTYLTTEEQEELTQSLKIVFPDRCRIRVAKPTDKIDPGMFGRAAGYNWYYEPLP